MGILELRQHTDERVKNGNPEVAYVVGQGEFTSRVKQTKLFWFR